VACGLCVANIYYIQPILPDMAASLRTSPQSVTPAISCTQIGYALGLFTLVPLGDVIDRRRLLTGLVTATAAVLAVIPFSAGIPLFCLFFLLGLVGVAAMVIVPQAANMAVPERRGQVVGTVMTGLILGTLLCRTFAGGLADVAGWRSVYWVAAGLMVVVCLVLRRLLPAAATPGQVSLRGYARLLGSVLVLVRHNSVLVERSLYGALGFATFNGLWTALPLRLSQSPYHYGPGAIGLLGLLGAAGALGASLAGKLADRGRQVLVTAVAFAIITLSFAITVGYSAWLVILALAILLIDFAVQGAHITNQATVFASVDSATRSRVTTAYMTTYFLGGGVGAGVTSAAWPHGGWSTTSLIGAGMGLCGLLLLLGYRLARRWRTTTREGELT
jgi:predicted MFS family arabinose efflux permease